MSKIDFSKNPVYVIGDVHGCYYTLMKLLEKLPLHAEILFVGDLCDKGNYSKEVIELVMAKGYRCVKGNHEHLMEKYLYDAVVHDKHSPWSEDYRYGGLETYRGYLNDHRSMYEHLEWIKTLPTHIEIDHYFITHGFGLPFYEERDNPEFYNDFLLNRYETETPVTSSHFINIFGHCAFDEVVKEPSFFCIDTKCSYGNNLTALELGSHRIIQETMDSRDSSYKIKELELAHIEPYYLENNDLSVLVTHIDQKFEHFDLVSTEVAQYIADQFGAYGVEEITYMLEKKQLFPKQAKKIMESCKSVV